MTDADKREAFFYAMQEAGLYDSTIEWVAPYYRAMHEMMHRFATDALCASNGGKKGAKLILDIGCGTGAEAMPLLLENPAPKPHRTGLRKHLLALLGSSATNSRLVKLVVVVVDGQPPMWITTLQIPVFSRAAASLPLLIL